MSQKLIYPISLGTLKDLIQSTMLRRDWHIRWPITLQLIISKNATRTGLCTREVTCQSHQAYLTRGFQSRAVVFVMAPDNPHTYLPVDDKADATRVCAVGYTGTCNPSTPRFWSGHYMSNFELNWSPTILEGSLCQTKGARTKSRWLNHLRAGLNVINLELT